MSDDLRPALPTPLTRREARALEQAAQSRQPRIAPPPPAAPQSVRSRRGGARSLRLGKELASSSHARPRASFGSKLLSGGAMLLAAAVLVGMSVPVNAFIGPGSTALATPDAKPLLVAGQSLKVSADAAQGATARDSFEVISYAQVLALKYAGIDYSYSVTTGAVRWPFPYAVPITDGFGPRDGGFHKGVDFVPGAGTPIYAVADGIATTAGYDESGYGNHVVLQHNLGGVNVESLYGHMIMDSSPIVVGQQVKVGDFLGLVGDTGVAYGAHLHFEIHIDKVPVDPFAWLQANASN